MAGGIHTPNHRWVVCAALARLNALFSDPRCVARIDEWLGEGIDIDEDGQFSERSTSVYSPTCDRAFLAMARLLGREALLEPVRRNLEMTLHYLHPDGDVATEASRRQDQYRRGSAAGYHLPYRALALRDGNGRFAAAARLIEEREGDALAGSSSTSSRIRPPPASAARAPPEEFARHFRGSTRPIRRGGERHGPAATPASSRSTRATPRSRRCGLRPPSSARGSSWRIVSRSKGARTG
jgi:hypothetical protein